MTSDIRARSAAFVFIPCDRLFVVCTTMSKGIFALFSATERPIVHLQTGNTFSMPYVTSGPSVNNTALGGATALTLHVRPLYDRALLAAVRYYRWRHVYYIYDSEDGQCCCTPSQYCVPGLYYVASIKLCLHDASVTTPYRSSLSTSTGIHVSF